MKITLNGFNLSSRIEQLEEQISSFSSTKQKYKILREGLDQTFDALTHLKTEAFVTKQMEEKMIRLFGELENKAVERDLSHIQKETTSLQKGRISNKAIDQLEKRVRELKEKHLPLIQGRQIIRAAEEALTQAKRKREGNIERPLSKQIKKTEAVESLDPAEVYDLLEVARALHNGDLKQARKLFMELPQHHQDRFERLMGNLPAIAFEDQVPTIQALIATANELVGNGEGYPHPSEIDQYFLKTETLSEQASKIIQIDFNLINRHG